MLCECDLFEMGRMLEDFDAELAQEDKVAEEKLSSLEDLTNIGETGIADTDLRVIGAVAPAEHFRIGYP